MNKKVKWWLYGISGLVLLFGAGGIGIWFYLYPFGHRPCTLNCMDLALRDYADDHNGFFPNSDHEPLDALQKLYPKYTSDRLLAGITGDATALKSILEAGKPLDNSTSSWVYIPGLNQNDSPNLAILWEARKGILPNGRRASTPVHAVLFNFPASIKLIPDSEWSKFLVEQELLLKKTFEGRLGMNREQR